MTWFLYKCYLSLLVTYVGNNAKQKNLCTSECEQRLVSNSKDTNSTDLEILRISHLPLIALWGSNIIHLLYNFSIWKK